MWPARGTDSKPAHPRPGENFCRVALSKFGFEPVYILLDECQSLSRLGMQSADQDLHLKLLRLLKSNAQYLSPLVPAQLPPIASGARNQKSSDMGRQMFEMRSHPRTINDSMTIIMCERRTPEFRNSVRENAFKKLRASFRDAIHNLLAVP